MIIQSPNILRRLGKVTASGIHVVPDPIRSMLTPTGPIIMSSVVCPGIAAIPAIPGFAGIPAISGMLRCAESVFGDMFMWVVSMMAEGICCISIAPVFGDRLFAGAAFAGIGIEIVGDFRLATGLALVPALTEVFFLVCVPIG